MIDWNWSAWETTVVALLALILVVILRLLNRLELIQVCLAEIAANTSKADALPPSVTELLAPRSARRE